MHMSRRTEIRVFVTSFCMTFDDVDERLIICQETRDIHSNTMDNGYKPIGCNVARDLFV